MPIVAERILVVLSPGIRPFCGHFVPEETEAHPGVQQLPVVGSWYSQFPPQCSVHRDGVRRDGHIRAGGLRPSYTVATYYSSPEVSWMVALKAAGSCT
jgi:hypothetical protein